MNAFKSLQKTNQTSEWTKSSAYKRITFEDTFRINTPHFDYNNNNYIVEGGNNDGVVVTDYFKRIAKEFNNINMDQRILSGMPVVTSTRIPISLIIESLGQGISAEDISADYNITLNDIKVSVDFVVKILNSPFYEDI